MKKVTGDRAPQHYQVIDEETGEVLFDRQPEYVTMSRRPGIATEWWKAFSTDVTNGDYVVLRGQKMRPPKFYDRLFEVSDEEAMRWAKIARKKQARTHADNNTPERRRVREELQHLRLEKLPRNLE